MDEMNLNSLQVSLLAMLRARIGDAADPLTLDDWWTMVDGVTQPRAREMVQVVRTAKQLLQNLYVHMDLKRWRHGIDPVAKLNALEDSITFGAIATPRQFHRAMLVIFKMCGDIHTAYRLPEPQKRAVAFLPFLLQKVYDGDKPRYFVSDSQFDQDPSFWEVPLRVGTEVVSWNGVGMQEAVKQAAELEEGSNEVNDLALALQFMTVRWLGASFEPDVPEVTVGYRTADGDEGTAEFLWSVFLAKDPDYLVTLQAVDAVFGRPRSNGDVERSLHVGGDVVHSVRLALYRPDRHTELLKLRREQANALEDLGNELRRMFYGYVDRRQLNDFTKAHKQLHPIEADWGRVLPSLLPVFLEASILDGDELLALAGGDPRKYGALGGKRIGYIRIRAFPLHGPERGLFKYELRRLLNEMPGDGLILDIRDNPGGSTINAEGSLQFLTANDITPIPFRFMATELTHAIAKKEFKAYEPSINACLRTGERFSAGHPITPRVQANDLGQHYFGPAVLITSALTYSAGDIFAAGFLDNEIGEVLGVDETTGAGGANSWFYEPSVRRASGAGEPLGSGINMQFAVRQCLRVGKGYLGVPIEEVGVRSEKPHRLTREDLTEERPWRLLLEAAARVVGKPSYEMETSLVDPAERRVVVRTVGIERLDFYVNGRPSSEDADVKGATTHAPVLPRDGKVELIICGFASVKGRTTRVARYIQVFPA